MKNYRMGLSILSLVISVISLSIILGVHYDVQKLKKSNDPKEVIADKIKSNVSLKVKNGTLSNTNATVILENNSNTSISYGNPYWIEKEENGEWKKVKTVNDMNFTMPAFECNPNEKKEIKIDWEYGYGKLSSGKYRIVKDVDFEYDDDIREFFYVTAEFTID